MERRTIVDKTFQVALDRTGPVQYDTDCVNSSSCLVTPTHLRMYNIQDVEKVEPKLKNFATFQCLVSKVERAIL